MMVEFIIRVVCIAIGILIAQAGMQYVSHHYKIVATLPEKV